MVFEYFLLFQVNSVLHMILSTYLMLETVLDVEANISKSALCELYFVQLTAHYETTCEPHVS